MYLHTRPSSRCFNFRHRRSVNAVALEADFYELAHYLFHARVRVVWRRWLLNPGRKEDADVPNNLVSKLRVLFLDALLKPGANAKIAAVTRLPERQAKFNPSALRQLNLVSKLRVLFLDALLNRAQMLKLLQ